MKTKMSIKNRNIFKPQKLMILISSSLFLLGTGSQRVSADDYFDPQLLENVGSQTSNTDLSVFDTNDSQPPGNYSVDILINDERVDTQRNIEFKQTKNIAGKDVLQACLSINDLKSWGVKIELFPLLEASPDGCSDLSAIAQASQEFDFGQQQLKLSIPQAAISMQARGYVSPDQWNNGIPAMLLNYDFSGSQSRLQNSDGDNRANSQFLNLRPGLNLGPWRFRNYTTWGRDSKGETSTQAIYTYVQRDIAILRSQLIMGDSTSPSDVFESVPLRGVQISSDDDMLPDSLRGYAPVVRGIARTNAQVVIRQSGYIIYQSYVAPGAFEITDMYSTGGNGDLDVTIKESDGSEQHLIFPFASLPVLMREGRMKYSMSGGEFRSYDNNIEKMKFAQLTGIYGLPHGMTLYGGAQGASHYQSVALGLGANLGSVGALSVDVTHAAAEKQGLEKTSGDSWRVRYSKNLVETGTNFAIAGYRYSTAGYATLQEVANSYNAQSGIQYSASGSRNRAEISMNQKLSDQLGSLNISAVREDYWGEDRRMQSISTSYSNSWNQVSYNINYTYAKNSSSTNNDVKNNDHSVTFNISIPLSKWLPSTSASYSLNQGSNQKASQSVGLYGSALADNNLNWSVQQSYSAGSNESSSNLNTNYRGTYGELSGGYSSDTYQQRLNYGVRGAVLIHEDGLTLGQSLGETIVLVKAPGATGVGINNQSGVKTDYRGYAIVPFVSPYRQNTVALDNNTLPDDMDVDINTQTVVPTRGAVMRADFAPQIGYRAVITLQQPNGKPVPFGATVTQTDTTSPQGSIVGDGGSVYLTGLSDKGRLMIRWGKSPDNQCQVDYRLSDQKPAFGIYKIENLQCRRL
ncbi:Fimbrial biogenesis outer membrane usher protein [Yersinia aldovae]|nr:fimbria/pilus outer membrane usher protein [Yersinia aldovae]CNG96643.1 Fimbrial biogenesis outer membrane usher protein [Yersinia aldovae]